jgi:archaellum biogenesis protein FlaJ (TadC family)
LRLPQMTTRRLMIAVAALSVAAWLWVCFFSGIDWYESTVYLVTGSCFLVTVSAVFALLAVAMMLNPSDPPPVRAPSGTPERSSQYRIGTLMIAIAAMAFVLAIIRLASR